MTTECAGRLILPQRAGDARKPSSSLAVNAAKGCSADSAEEHCVDAARRVLLAWYCCRPRTVKLLKYCSAPGALSPTRGRVGGNERGSVPADYQAVACKPVFIDIASTLIDYPGGGDGDGEAGRHHQRQASNSSHKQQQ